MSNNNNNNFVLYMHLTPNNKKYFGITGQEVNKRWQNGYGYRNQVFWRAIQKYGWENIGHYILADNLTKEEACFFEQVMIALYDTTNPNNGYNSTTGGEHFNHSEESKQKISDNKKGRKNPKFKPIICITTGRCFNTSKEAADYCNLKSGNNIGRCCRGEKASSGQLNGEKLVWRFISDLPKPTNRDKEHLRYILNKYCSHSA